jgi:hypothetical protein
MASLLVLASAAIPRYSSGQQHPGRSAMAMNVGVLDHYNVSTRKLKETIQF